MASNYEGLSLSQNTMEVAHMQLMREVWQERIRQIDKFGWQDRPMHEWKIILDEEVGEMSHEVCECYFQNEEFSDKYRKELIEVVAVGLAALLNYDERKRRAGL